MPTDGNSQPPAVTDGLVCEYCQGLGVVWVRFSYGDVEQDCLDCNGTGEVDQ